MRSVFRQTALIILGLLCITGCEEDIIANLSIDHPYSMFGIFNPKTDTHTVRIFELQERIQLVRPDPIDAVVTSINLDTNEQTVWRDSVIQLADGDYRHVYWAAFDAEPGDRYRLEVVRSDGATSSAELIVPPRVSLFLPNPPLNQQRDIKIPALIQGDPPSLPRIDLSYDTVSILEDDVTQYREHVVISYDNKPFRVSGGRLLEIELSRDFGIIRQVYSEKSLPNARIILNGVSLDVHVGDTQWISPTGEFDPDFLVEPATFSNVENGFGFVGSGYVETIAWDPTPILTERAGFFIGSSDPDP